MHSCMVNSEFFTCRSGAAATLQAALDHFIFKIRIVLRHEKHPKGWIGVQLLGCSSYKVAFSIDGKMLTTCATKFIC